MKRKKCLIALLLLVVLSACSSYVESRDDNPPQNGTEISEDTHGEQYGKIINISKSSYACSKDGVYELRSLYPNSVNIIYTDFEKAQTLVLCGQPNCTHNSSSCVSYIPIEEGNLEPTIMCNNECLIIVKEGAGPTESPYVAVAELNGSDRHVVTTYKSNQLLQGDFLANSRYFYLIVQEVDDNGVPSFSLQEIDLQHDRNIELIQLPNTDKMYALMGAYGGSVFLLEMDTNNVNGERKIYEIDPANPNLNNIFLCYNAEQEYVLVEDPFLYIMQKEGNNVTRVLLSKDGEDKEQGYTSMENQDKISYLFDTDAYKTLLEPSSDGNAFIYEYYNEGELRKTYLNFETGDTREIILTSKYSKKPMQILATYKNRYFVLYDRKEKALEADNGNSYGVAFENQYALISMNNYISGEPEFEFIRDAV